MGRKKSAVQRNKRRIRRGLKPKETFETSVPCEGRSWKEISQSNGTTR